MPAEMAVVKFMPRVKKTRLFVKRIEAIRMRLEKTISLKLKKVEKRSKALLARTRRRNKRVNGSK